MNQEYFYFLVVMAIAALVHGTLGLGFPMVATPLLALATDIRQAVLLTLLPTIVVNIASILRGGEWRQSVFLYWPMAVYAMLGSVLGSYFCCSPMPIPCVLSLPA